MLRPLHFILLVSLLVDGGTGSPQPGITGSDAGTTHPRPNTAAADAGTVAPAVTAQPIQWPEEIRPLATLEGPAILAAHTALQQAMKRFPKERTKECAFSAQALEVAVGYEAGLYFVQVNRRVDKCPGFAPGVTLEFDWFEVYAIAPDGRLLERAPFHP